MRSTPALLSLSFTTSSTASRVKVDRPSPLPASLGPSRTGRLFCCGRDEARRIAANIAKLPESSLASRAKERIFGLMGDGTAVLIPVQQSGYWRVKIAWPGRSPPTSVNLIPERMPRNGLKNTIG
jgi:hypothetical protein